MIQGCYSIYERELSNGKVARQYVMCERDEKYLVWYRDQDSDNLNCYWANKQDFLSKFKYVKSIHEGTS